MLRRRPALPAFVAAMVLVLAQLIGLAHQAAIRHVTCNEHGEELELAPLAEALHACGDQHLIAVAGDTDSAHHDDCLLARALHQSSAAPTPTPIIIPTLTELPAVAALALAHARPATLYRIAPKTSPPV
jgi:hypothetical protein